MLLAILREIAQIARVIEDIISGKQEAYIKNYLDGVFENGDGPSGMRLSVYCATRCTTIKKLFIRQIMPIPG